MIKKHISNLKQALQSLTIDDLLSLDHLSVQWPTEFSVHDSAPRFSRVVK